MVLTGKLSWLFILLKHLYGDGLIWGLPKTVQEHPENFWSQATLIRISNDKVIMWLLNDHMPKTAVWIQLQNGEKNALLTFPGISIPD